MSTLILTFQFTDFILQYYFLDFRKNLNPPSASRVYQSFVPHIKYVARLKSKYLMTKSHFI